MLILIPAYEPGPTLIDLVADLRQATPRSPILIIDDGSGNNYNDIFAATATEGAEVIRFAENRGKGAALKSGFAHAWERYRGHTVVCADSDGQHKLADILAVANAVKEHDTMVLGVRRFTGQVPFRSRLGNRATALLFGTLTGTKLGDTQTGLRAYPSSLLVYLQNIPGDRFEYEMNLLLEGHKSNITIQQVEIKTVYSSGNKSSHFRPLLDSLKVWSKLLTFAASSIVGFVVDFIAVLLLMRLTHNLLLSVITARIISSTVNFSMNRKLVFSSQTSVISSAIRYATLAIAILAANYFLLKTLIFSLPLASAKLLTEALLFGVSFFIQKVFVFKHPSNKNIDHEELFPTEENITSSY
ncbi:MAG: glycosyltransferase [Propionibacteriaceae bacterium]